MRPGLSLFPVGSDEFEKVSSVQVTPDQIRFSGTVLDAFDDAEEGVDFHGIGLGDLAVGFFKIDRFYASRFPFVECSELGLRAFMVDRDQQGKGLATDTVRALPGYLRQLYPNATALVLTVNLANPGAIACYLKGGFADTGEIWPHGSAGPQHIMRMTLA
ncbi:MAG: GNAT family N-acetyltransferase [Rhodobacteraceae bacterium]|nr:GNAT family N-acetyltransferase [Paracoccaceae bacterium]